MTGIVLDLDGVVYRGRDEVPGAGEALTRIAAHHRLVFATNNSSRRPHEVAEKIRSVTGFDAHPSMVVTSAMAAAHVADPVPTLVLGGDGIVEALTGRGVEVADGPEIAQVVSGIDFAFDYAALRTASVAIRAGARWIATNTDATFPAEREEWPGAGAIVAALATASGRRPEVAGKPHRPMIELLEAKLGDARVLVVGDRPETDIALGRAAGWTTILALSGVTPTAGTVPDHLRPDATIDSLADLEGAIGRLGMA